jgi:hypothetical protein
MGTDLSLTKMRTSTCSGKHQREFGNARIVLVWLAYGQYMRSSSSSSFLHSSHLACHCPWQNWGLYYPLTYCCSWGPTANMLLEPQLATMWKFCTRTHSLRDMEHTRQEDTQQEIESKHNALGATKLNKPTPDTGAPLRAHWATCLLVTAL